ncbi:acyltransferase family protein [Hyphomonas neptunium ATCC 15444]|uniref:Acyltransferase family protein n=2 Tax=Hyphomonas TaxID=85 RepID=Q0C670_HYPNA|nr:MULTISPECIES: acyltransferase family protein [Hyphomonas]ABI76812.1 acyltransferase family protein [Hyphomonas neptunium ATCC 15444]KCZ94853.1 acyltransferase family protein [Hyphomonas hirschiana VP5]
MTNYRSDIDGLRALSIAPVMLFHAGYAFMPGGFVGVDTFFVLSGYLITSLIGREIEDSVFSFRHFYMRRIRRLLPALICVYAAVLGFSWIYDTQQNFYSAAEQIFASIFYVSNVYYLFNIDYFTGESLDFILLHTWSLSIEEQFYLIFPVAIWLAYKVSKSCAQALLITATIASFVFSAYLSLSAKQDGEYYHSFSRFWELGIGGCVALFRLQITRWITPIRLMALTVIVAAPFLIQPEYAFPFPSAIPSVLATVCLIIAWDGGKDMISRSLSLPLIVYIGKISYSLYIWHWVIFVAANKMGLFRDEALPLVFLVTILVSITSYHIVEKPFRYGRSNLRSNKAVLSYLGLASVAFILTPYAYTLALGRTVPLNPQNAYEKIMALNAAGFRESGELARSYRGGECFLEPSTPQTFAADCYTIAANQPNIALIGDSNAAHYSAGFRHRFPDAKILQLSGSNCMITIPGVLTRDMDGCRESNRLFFEKILPSDEIDLYIFSSRWSPSLIANGAFEKFLVSLKDNGIADKSVIIGRQAYFSHGVANQAVYSLRSMSAADWQPEELNLKLNEVIQIAESEADQLPQIDRELSRLAAKYGVSYVSALGIQQHPDGIEFISPQGDLLYWDSGHLTTEGAIYRVGQILADSEVREIVDKADVGNIRD